MNDTKLNKKLKLLESKNDAFVNEYYKDNVIKYNFDEEIDYEIDESDIERINPNIQNNKKYKKLSYDELINILKSTDNTYDFFEKVEMQNDK